MNNDQLILRVGEDGLMVLFPEELYGQIIRLTTLSMEMAESPDAHELVPSEESRSLLAVEGHAEGGWIYGAKIVEDIDPALAARLQEVLTEDVGGSATDDIPKLSQRYWIDALPRRDLRFIENVYVPKPFFLTPSTYPSSRSPLGVDSDNRTTKESVAAYWDELYSRVNAAAGRPLDDVPSAQANHRILAHYVRTFQRTVDLQVRGTLACELGIYMVDAEPPKGQKGLELGMYLAIWHKVGGSWLIDTHVLNSALQPFWMDPRHPWIL